MATADAFQGAGSALLAPDTAEDSLRLGAAQGSAAPAEPGKVGATGQVAAIEDAIEFGAIRRTFLVHEPASHTGDDGLRPLVLALHGGGGRGLGMSKLTEFHDIADREGFVVVYPDALDHLWKDAVERTRPDDRDIDDVGFFDALITYLLRRYRVDPARVYSTGISNGGHMTNRLAVELSGRFAAIGVVGATLDEAYAASHAPSRPVPIIYFHGTTDPLRYFDGGGAPGGKTLSARAMTKWWVEANGCPITPRISRIPPTSSDETSVTMEAYEPGREGSAVHLYIIEGGGHTWPGGLQYFAVERIGVTSRHINASELMWEFFAAYHR
jgi:polyhydroxybutyrate depolymerase